MKVKILELTPIRILIILCYIIAIIYLGASFNWIYTFDNNAQAFLLQTQNGTGSFYYKMIYLFQNNLHCVLSVLYSILFFIIGLGLHIVDTIKSKA